MNRSTNYGFYLPTNADPMLVSDLTYNFEQIDPELADRLKLTQQTLTTAQKSQVLQNLGIDQISNRISNFTSKNVSTISEIRSAVPNNGDNAVLSGSGTFSALFGLTGVTFGVFRNVNGRIDGFVAKGNGILSLFYIQTDDSIDYKLINYSEIETLKTNVATATTDIIAAKADLTTLKTYDSKTASVIASITNGSITSQLVGNLVIVNFYFYTGSTISGDTTIATLNAAHATKSIDFRGTVKIVSTANTVRGVNVNGRSVKTMIDQSITAGWWAGQVVCAKA